MDINCSACSMCSMLRINHSDITLIALFCTFCSILSCVSPMFIISVTLEYSKWDAIIDTICKTSSIHGYIDLPILFRKFIRIFFTYFFKSRWFLNRSLSLLDAISLISSGKKKEGERERERERERDEIFHGIVYWCYYMITRMRIYSLSVNENNYNLNPN